MAKKYDKSFSWSALAILAILGASVSAVSAYVLWLGDDVDYGAFIRDSIWNSWGPLDSWSKFWESQANHYLHVNGRFVAHALVQLFCGVVGQQAFAVCNGLVYIAFIILTARISGIRKPLREPWSIALISALVILTFVTKMMPTTQIGFIWMMTLNLAFLLCLHRNRDLERRFPNRRKSDIKYLIPTSLLALLAGNSQEALTPGIAIALLFGLWTYWRKTKKIPWPSAVCVIAYCLGTAAIVFSPSTLARAEAASVPVGDSLIYATLSLRAFYLMAIVIAWRVWRGDSFRRICRENCFWLTALCVLMLMNFAVGVYCNRQLFGVELCALIVALRLLRPVPKGLAVIAIIAATALIITQTVLAGRVRKQFQAIEAQAQTTKNGVVYYDRVRATNCPYFREFRYYEDIVGLYNNDTHHSLQKLVRRRNHGLHTIYVWPEYMRGRKVAVDTVIEYAPHHYFVVAVDASPRRTYEFRDGHAIELEPTKAAVKGRNWNGYLIVPQRPWTLPDSILRR